MSANSFSAKLNLALNIKATRLTTLGGATKYIGEQAFTLERLVNAATLLTGTEANQASQIFPYYGEIQPNNQNGLDVIQPAGQDPLGNPFTWTKIKVILIQNLGSVENQESDIILVGGTGGGTPWTSPFNGIAASQVSLHRNGLFLLTAPSIAGYPIAADGSLGQLINLFNNTPRLQRYQAIFIGA